MSPRSVSRRTLLTGAGGLRLTVTKSGSQPDTLLSGTTAVCAAVEPHAMPMDGDAMAMAFLPGGLLVPPGATVTLGPAGDHVMLVGRSQDPRPDTTFPISLRFQRAGTVDLTSAVRWVLETDDLGKSAGVAALVSTGDPTIVTIWSRPAPMLSAAAGTVRGT